MGRPIASGRTAFSQKEKAAVGKRLLESAEKAGKNGAWLADKLGVSESHVSKMFKTGSVSLWVAARISQLLGVSLDYLVFGTFPSADADFVRQLKNLMAKTDESNRPIQK